MLLVEPVASVVRGWLRRTPASRYQARLTKPRGCLPPPHPRIELRQEAVELVALHTAPLSIHKAGQRVLLAQRGRACINRQGWSVGSREGPPGSAASSSAVEQGCSAFM